MSLLMVNKHIRQDSIQLCVMNDVEQLSGPHNNHSNQQLLVLHYDVLKIILLSLAARCVGNYKFTMVKASSRKTFVFIFYINTFQFFTRKENRSQLLKCVGTIYTNSLYLSNIVGKDYII